MKTLLLALLSVSIVSCAGSKNDEQNSAEVNGKSANEYYGELITKDLSESCRKMDWPVSVELTYLRGQLYGERILIELQDSNRLSLYFASQTVSGKWSIDRTQLVLEGLGVGHGIIHNEVPGVEIQFGDGTKVPEALKTQVILFEKTTGKYKCPDRI